MRDRKATWLKCSLTLTANMVGPLSQSGDKMVNHLWKACPKISRIAFKATGVQRADENGMYPWGAPICAIMRLSIYFRLVR